MSNTAFWLPWTSCPIATAVYTRRSTHGHELRCEGQARCTLTLNGVLLAEGGEGMDERSRLMGLAESMVRNAERKVA